jgi:hypothetical protein
MTRSGCLICQGICGKCRVPLNVGTDTSLLGTCPVCNIVYSPGRDYEVRGFERVVRWVRLQRAVDHIHPWSHTEVSSEFRDDD